MRVVSFAPPHEHDALRFLDREPYDNVFLSWTIREKRSSATRGALRICENERGILQGVALFGRQVVLAAEDDAVVDAFAAAAPPYGAERMIVSPRPLVERYWSAVRTRHAGPRILRESQPLFAVDAASLRTAAAGVAVRRAKDSEWETVARQSAQMIGGELGYDPLAQSVDFLANVRHMIARGLWWVGESEGRLCFFCHVGPHSRRTLQLQGIWTPPELRGRGLATASLAGACARLLRDAASVSLYVNDFNRAALALYDRVGFRRVGEFATILF